MNRDIPKQVSSLPIEILPAEAQSACSRLRTGLQERLGDELVGLWVYGAATFAERPAMLGDVDTYGVLVRRPDRKVAIAIDELHDIIAADLAVEWDSWYVLRRDAQQAAPPRHALRENAVDRAWALHRAHWLRGQYVGLVGCAPSELVQMPSWEEIKDGLRSEISHIDRFLALGDVDAQHAAYAIWNSCRIIYTLETRDAVISKKAAATWALDHMPQAWQPAIRASGRIYDGLMNSSDESILRSSVGPIVLAARERLRQDDE